MIAHLVSRLVVGSGEPGLLVLAAAAAATLACSLQGALAGGISPTRACSTPVDRYAWCRQICPV